MGSMTADTPDVGWEEGVWSSDKRSKDRLDLRKLSKTSGRISLTANMGSLTVNTPDVGWEGVFDIFVNKDRTG